MNLAKLFVVIGGGVAGATLVFRLDDTFHAIGKWIRSRRRRSSGSGD